jgi:hypothetical protein
MELEEALALIDTQKTELQGLKDTHTTALGDLTKTHEKAIQVSYNKGFDKAKNASKDEVKDGYVKKEDVEEMLSKRDKNFSLQTALTKMGVKNPKRAMKSIDDDDLSTIGSEGFDEEGFKKKYGEDIVFTSSQKEEEGEHKKKPSNFTKNNKKVKTGLTAESYAEMSDTERAKISTADKLALLS